MTYRVRSNLTVQLPSTFHFKARLEIKHQLTGNSVIITARKTRQDLSVMGKRQVLMSSEPSRMLLNISNTKMRDFVFSEGRDLSPTPSSSEAAL